MKRLQFHLACLVCVLIAWARPAWAAFEDLGEGARAPGMGNAFTAVADDVYAVYYNPAGLAQLERPELSAAYSKLYIGLTDGSDLGVSQLTYAHPLKDGRWGTLGGAWQRFNLSDIYEEQSLYMSWGKRVLRRDSGSSLLAGMSAKYLQHSFRQLPEAFNALNQGLATGLPDPVLTGNTSKGAIDADIGLLYRFPRRFQMGFLAQHVMRPDVGFSGPDRLPMNMRLGLAYKSLWMDLSSELRVEPAPTGQTDHDIIFAGERYFPTLEHGQFGLRGSLGLGSRQWKQITMGTSYRINKIQMDYAFMLPIGTIKGTAGTHRIALTFHFGAPTAEEQISQELLSQARELREGKGPGYGYEFLESMRPRDLNDPQLAKVRREIEEGHFRRAYTDLFQFAKNLMPDEPLVRLANRLDIVAYYYADMPEPKEHWETMLFSAIKNFLYGHDRAAILQASYALSMNPQDVKLDNFLSKLEDGVSIKAVRLPPGHPRTFMEELLYRVEMANNRGENDLVLSLLKDILDISPDNATALERTGSAYYVLQRYKEAMATWQKALSLETDPKERATLIDYMTRTSQKLGVAASEISTATAAERTSPSAAVPSGSALGPGTAATQPAVKAQPASPVRSVQVYQRADPRDVERLYQKGVEHYARGEYLQATAMFMRILQIDPENGPARKALARIRSKQ